jgi:3-hydroxyisobutyrate dehydrogenase
MASIRNVAFIGVGNMGAPMAAHLVAAAFDVTVFDVRPEAMHALARAHGAKAAASLAEAGRGADAAITMLPDSSIVREVLLGPDGVASTLRPGAVAVDMGTSDPHVTVEVGAELARRGIGYVDAPVMGGVIFAADKTLDIMAGGEDGQIERCMPLFAALGRRVFRCGRLGSGHALKALANYVNAATLVAVLEAMTIGAKFGLGTDTMAEALVAMCAGRQHPLEKKVVPHVLTRAFATGMTLGLIAKDVKIAVEFARSVEAAAPLGERVREIWAEAAATIGASADQTEIVRLWEEADGVTLSTGERR